MSKAHKRPPKSGPVWQVSAMEATRLAKPRYNGWACGTGVHGDVKYNRAKEKRNWSREVHERGLPFFEVRAGRAAGIQWLASWSVGGECERMSRQARQGAETAQETRVTRESLLACDDCTGMSASAKAKFAEIVDADLRAPFASPAAFEGLLQAARENDGKPVQVPDYIRRQLRVAERRAADGTQLVELAPPDGPTSPVHMLWIHGGGFVMTIGKPDWDFCLALLQRVPCRITLPFYPLAPAHTWQDTYRSVIAAYRDLLERASAEHLVVAGNSAGGHLAVALAQMALLQGMPQPALIVALSPWIDPGNELAAAKEPLDEVDALLGAHGLAQVPRYWCPQVLEGDFSFPPCSLHGPLEGLAPMIVNYGTREMFSVEDALFVEQALRAGVEVDATAAEGMWHTYPMVPGTDEADAAMDKLVAALEALA